MRRRRFLAGLGGSAMLTAGCTALEGLPGGAPPVGESLPSAQTPMGVTASYDSRSYPPVRMGEDVRVLARDERHQLPSGREQTPYYGVIGEREAIDEAVILTADAPQAADVRTFIDKTDFEEAWLVVFEDQANMDMDLRLAAIEHRDGKLQLDIMYNRGNSVPDTAAGYSLLVRLSGIEPKPPDQLSFTVREVVE